MKDTKSIYLPAEVIEDLQRCKTAYSICLSRRKDKSGNPIPVRVTWEQLLRRWMEQVGRFDPDVKALAEELKELREEKPPLPRFDPTEGNIWDLKYTFERDGEEIEAPLFYRQLLNKVRKWQRLLSKAQKGSAHYRAYRRQLNRVYRELSDKRTDWNYKTPHDLCRHYDAIFVEDLNIAAMQRLWGRKVSDLGWTSFLATLDYVASKYGTLVHRIDRFYPSSRLCTCGYKNDALTLGDRFWTCPACGAYHDRDLQASQNILRRGIADLGSTRKTGIAG